jgi:hypothetical protein
MQTRHHSALHGTSAGDIDQALEVEADHMKWWTLVDEHLSDEERTQSVSKAHQVTLIVLRFESVIALHRSVLATSRKNAAYNAALQRCLFASRSIINTLHKALNGFGAFDGSPGQSGYEKTPLLWPSFTWAVWMSMFVIFSAAMEEQIPRDVGLRLADRSVQILRHLALRGSNWPDACIVAIQNLTERLRGSSDRSSLLASRATQPKTPFGDQPVPRSRSINTHTNRDHLQEQTSHTNNRQLRPSSQVTPRMAMSNAADPGLPPSYIHQPYGVSRPVDIDAFNLPQSANMQDGLTNTQLLGPGDFLGISQQFSDNPLSSDEIMHLFNGEDMAYWLGGDAGSNGGNMSYNNTGFY